jgi:hypothetical protein
MGANARFTANRPPFYFRSPGDLPARSGRRKLSLESRAESRQCPGGWSVGITGTGFSGIIKDVFSGLACPSIPSIMQKMLRKKEFRKLILPIPADLRSFPIF